MTFGMIPNIAGAMVISPLPVEAKRFMTQRTKATVTGVDTSHASPLSQPDIMIEVIAAAARSEFKN